MGQVKALCEKYNVLLIADEVQSGLGRTGKVLANEHWLGSLGKKPDIVCLGKALSGGFLPASGIIADEEVMGVIGFGDHGSTFGGSALAMAVVRASIDVIQEDNLVENSAKMGSLM